MCVDFRMQTLEAGRPGIKFVPPLVIISRLMHLSLSLYFKYFFLVLKLASGVQNNILISIYPLTKHRGYSQWFKNLLKPNSPPL